MEKKLTSRQKQAIATKEKIYKTGVQLFKEHGFQSVSVEEIAKQANVGIGTFYHYYKSKLELYTELFINAEDYFEEFKHLDLSKEDIRIVLLRYFHQYVRLNEEMGLEFCQMMSTLEGRKMLEGNQAFESQLEDIFIHYQKQGVIRSDISTAQLTNYFFICARGVLYDWSMCSGAYVLQDKMKEIIEFLFKGCMA